jgi:hypothetical protein
MLSQGINVARCIGVDEKVATKRVQVALKRDGRDHQQRPCQQFEGHAHQVRATLRRASAGGAATLHCAYEAIRGRLSHPAGGSASGTALHAVCSMFVRVVHVRHVRVRVLEAFMTMRVRVGFSRRIIRTVLVLVMRIMNVRMRMLH